MNNFDFSFAGPIGSMLQAAMQAQNDRLEATLDRFIVEDTGSVFAIYKQKQQESIQPRLNPFGENDQRIDRKHYNHILTDKLTDSNRDTSEILASISSRFAPEKSKKLHGHSLAFGDVIVLKRGDQISCYFVDAEGFQPISDFLSPEDPQC